MSLIFIWSGFYIFRHCCADNLDVAGLDFTEFVANATKLEDEESFQLSAINDGERLSTNVRKVVKRHSTPTKRVKYNVADAEDGLIVDATASESTESEPLSRDLVDVPLQTDDGSAKNCDTPTEFASELRELKEDILLRDDEDENRVLNREESDSGDCSSNRRETVELVDKISVRDINQGSLESRPHVASILTIRPTDNADAKPNSSLRRPDSEAYASSSQCREGSDSRLSLPARNRVSSDDSSADSSVTVVADATSPSPDIHHPKFRRDRVRFLDAVPITEILVEDEQLAVGDRKLKTVEIVFPFPKSAVVSKPLDYSTDSTYSVRPDSAEIYPLAETSSSDVERGWNVAESNADEAWERMKGLAEQGTNSGFTEDQLAPMIGIGDRPEQPPDHPTPDLHLARTRRLNENHVPELRRSSMPTTATAFLEPRVESPERPSGSSPEPLVAALGGVGATKKEHLARVNFSKIKRILPKKRKTAK